MVGRDFSPLLAENCFHSQFAFHCHFVIPRAVAMLRCLSSLSHTPAICALVGDNAVDPIVRWASVPPFCLGWLSLLQVLRCGYSLSSRGFVWGLESAYRRAPLLREECLSMCWTVNVCIKSKGLHRNVGSSAALNVFLKKAVFLYMLKQPPAVGLDILGKLGPRSSMLH